MSFDESGVIKYITSKYYFNQTIVILVNWLIPIEPISDFHWNSLIKNIEDIVRTDWKNWSSALSMTTSNGYVQIISENSADKAIIYGIKFRFYCTLHFIAA